MNLRPASTGLHRGATLPSEAVRPLGFFAQIDSLITTMQTLEAALVALQRNCPAPPTDTQQVN